MFDLNTVAHIISSGVGEIKKEEHELESTYKCIVAVIRALLSIIVILTTLIAIYILR